MSESAAGRPARRKRWLPWGSPLTRRILAVNLMALVILAAGLFYLDRYKQGLINAQLESLRIRAEMFAGAVGEGAVLDEDFDTPELDEVSAEQMIRRMAEPAQVRARLFGTDGTLMADSRLLRSRGTVIQVEDLPPPPPNRVLGMLRLSQDWLGRMMSDDSELPREVDRLVQVASDYPEVAVALNGEQGWAVRHSDARGLVLSVAVPVQHYKQVVGAVMLSAYGTDIARGLVATRLAILEVFVVSLGVTVLMSVYLASTIARPIRLLAVAADRVRRGHGRRHTIPDLTARGDEIGELSEALREMTEALWRRMDAIEGFAADVAHEIKNPLTSVRSAVETVRRVSDPVQQARLMAIIEDDVTRLDRLISDISDASRLDAELSRAEPEPLDMRRVLAALVDVYRATGAFGGVRFDLDLPDSDPLTLPGIEGRLVQVLRNLVANAVSFSPPDGLIRLTARRDNGFVRVEIEDDGPGIPDNKLHAIFDRFYSERPKGEKFGTHSGLGLSISKQIVDAHRGTITAENRANADGSVAGARFVVRLPAA